MVRKKIEEAEELTPEQIAELKADLERIRDELNSKARARIEEGTYNISKDDTADTGDLACVENSQELGMTIAENERKKLDKVMKALKKIAVDDGSFGYCEGTDEPIGFKRLKAAPWARFSLRHQEELEKYGKA